MSYYPNNMREKKPPFSIPQTTRIYNVWAYIYTANYFLLYRVSYQNLIGGGCMLSSIKFDAEFKSGKTLSLSSKKLDPYLVLDRLDDVVTIMTDDIVSLNAVAQLKAADKNILVRFAITAALTKVVVSDADAPDRISDFYRGDTSASDIITAFRIFNAVIDTANVISGNHCWI